MKIVQAGKIDIQNEIRIKCSVCEAIFDISAEDIEKDEGIRMYFTTCPNSACKRKIEIYEGTIPRNILWKLDLRETN